MSSTTDSMLRNRLISRQLDVGRRKNDATSESACDPSEAVESVIHTFAQTPSSADRLRGHQGPLDELVGPIPAATGREPGAASTPTAANRTPAASQHLSAAKVLESAAVLGISVEKIQSELVDAGYMPDGIDGHFGPKTLEAMNLFDQDQIDALKLQGGGVVSAGTKEPVDSVLQKLIKHTLAYGLPAEQSKSILANPVAKTLSATDATSKVDK